MGAFALKHARPRALEAAKHAASAAVVQMPQRTQAPSRRYAAPIADVVRCPWCDCAACDVKRGVTLRECVWCSSVSWRRADGTWLLYGELGNHHG